MVIVEIKSMGQRLTINCGKIIEGDMQFASTVKQLAKKIASSLKCDDLDYCIAQELVALHGGRIERQETIMDDQGSMKNRSN